MPASMRAYSEEEMDLLINAYLKPDAVYYLAQQVSPMVTRLRELVEGIDAIRIATALGLDPSQTGIR